MAQFDVECLVLDVDGVLTDGRLWYGSQGEPLRAFHIHDGLAIQWFQRLVGPVAILTAKRSTAVAMRAEELGVRRVIQGSRDKLADLTAHASKWSTALERIAYVGDDLPDLPAMRACGYAIAPSDAAEEVRAAADWVTTRGGGRGAVREAVEHLMRRAGRWEQVIAQYAGDAAAPATAAGGEDERE